MKTALVTGVTGQDGSYLSEFLIKKGYQVHGILRRSSTKNTQRIEHLYSDEDHHEKNFFLHYGDLCDGLSLLRIIKEVKPDEIYNLAAQSHVKVSFETPEFTALTDAVGTLRLLEAIRILDFSSKVKFYQASTSELYGNAEEIPQSEKTPFHPRSPYGVAKLYSYWIVKNYREAYDLFACNGILFNHESPRRGETFVTKKITKGLCEIKSGKLDCLYLGNLDAKRDWGFAGDYVEAMWLMLQQSQPEDFVIATGETHSVREFVEECCKILNIELVWKGKGISEVGINTKNNQEIIKINPSYFRPSEVDYLVGDANKARKLLGWEPKINFTELVRMMIQSDLKYLSASNDGN